MISKATYNNHVITYIITVEPPYSGHHWDQVNTEVVLILGVNLYYKAQFGTFIDNHVHAYHYSGTSLFRTPLGPLSWLQRLSSFQGWIYIIKHRMCSQVPLQMKNTTLTHMKTDDNLVMYCWLCVYLCCGRHIRLIINNCNRMWD